ncbi:MAG TPA: prepilin-type N-terminal cleavage/methylation domain-containing protein [Gemmatimonadales bacterium]|nr:prepilin-type N-terminal cleavage/methylation domain-containing protein [Gemmatimonadales bacterium]
MRRTGFTFIEILIVMIIIGILATLGWLRIQDQKEKGYIAAMTSDLRAMAEEQEAYYFQHQAYSATIDSLNPRPTPGDSLKLIEGTASGWSGSVSNGRTSRQCYIFVGTAAPVGTATNEGVISCS